MIIIKMALRNLFSHKMKTLIVGTVLILGSFFAVVGVTFVFAISEGMKNSLTHSITGDLQIYSKLAKDKFSIFGDENGSYPDIDYVENFATIKNILEKEVSNIEAIVPMGGNFAMVNPGNILDKKLEELRQCFKEKIFDAAKILELKEHVHAIILDIEAQFFNNTASIVSVSAEDSAKVRADLDTARAESFWKDFDAKFERKIEFLSNKIAPLIFDDNVLYVSYMGTIPETFARSFSQFEIVKGTNIPPGHRGMVLTDRFYEEEVKHRVARRLDKIKRSLLEDHETIKGSKTLQDKITSNISQSAEVYNQLTPKRAEEIVVKLQAFLSSKESDIKKLLEDFLKVDDANFISRYDFFYSEIAPYIVLYKVKVGEVFPITTFSKYGTSHSLNIKVYGTYRFKSFERSPIATGFNLIDLMSFRDLFGLLTPERKKENSEMEAEMALEDVSISDMFKKSDSKKESEGASLSKLKSTVFTSGFKEDFASQGDKVFSNADLENGIFLNAAILLKNPAKMAATMRAIDSVSEKEKLNIQVIDWKNAAGIIGQLILFIRVLLFSFIGIVFGVSIFIIMNAFIMAMLERYKEIGTMRAIGAQKQFVLSMLFFEVLIQSVFFACLGILLSWLVIVIVGGRGIPAWNDIATFFFSGSRLYLFFDWWYAAGVLLLAVIVSAIAGLYPAYQATKIPPVSALGKTH